MTASLHTAKIVISSLKEDSCMMEVFIMIPAALYIASVLFTELPAGNSVRTEPACSTCEEDWKVRKEESSSFCYHIFLPDKSDIN